MRRTIPTAASSRRSENTSSTVRRGPSGVARHASVAQTPITPYQRHVSGGRTDLTEDVQLLEGLAGDPDHGVLWTVTQPSAGLGGTIYEIDPTTGAILESSPDASTGYEQDIGYFNNQPSEPFQPNPNSV